MHLDSKLVFRKIQYFPDDFKFEIHGIQELKNIYSTS